MMVRWPRGADRIDALLARDQLQRVSGGVDAAEALLGMAAAHVDAAKPRSTDGLCVRRLVADAAVAVGSRARQARRSARPFHWGSAGRDWC
jgi:hypothetical protein